jgi:hypothetical protein
LLSITIAKVEFTTSNVWLPSRSLQALAYTHRREHQPQDLGAAVETSFASVSEVDWACTEFNCPATELQSKHSGGNGTACITELGIIGVRIIGLLEAVIASTEHDGLSGPSFTHTHRKTPSLRTLTRDGFFALIRRCREKVASQRITQTARRGPQ